MFTVLQTSQWFGLPIPLVSALLGGVLALLGSALFNWNQRRIERKRVRLALSVEMKMLKDTLDEFPDTEEGPENRHSPTDERVIGDVYSGYEASLVYPQYDENRGDLSSLSRYEVKRLIKFYDYIDRFWGRFITGMVD